jgi:ketosteroid isomerase-like protein
MKTNAEVVQNFYAALGVGDANAALALLADDVEWITMWHYQVRGRGPQRVAEDLLVPIMQEWHDVSFKASRYVVDGNTVVSIGRFTAVHIKSGQPVNARYAHVWTVIGGRIAAFDQFIDTLAVAQARQ